MRAGYIPTLDGWRAVAILAVILCHAAAALVGDQGLHPSPFWYGLTRHGALGVDIFFGISGFLICGRLIEEQRRTGRIDLRGFYIRRAFRILPPYLLYLLALGLCARAGLVAVDRREFLSCLLLFRNYAAPGPLGGWYTGHLWSLAIEEHFYLLWPGLLALCGIRTAGRLAVASALAIAAWRVLDFRHQWVAHCLPGIDFYTRTDIRLDALLWGCAAALLVSRGAPRERIRGALSAPAWAALAALFLLCVRYEPPLAMLWQSLLIPLLLLGTVLQPLGLLGRLLESPVSRWTGRVSYSLYLWQQFFLVHGRELENAPLGPLQRWPLNLPALFACAALSYHVMERPLMRLGQALSSRTREEGRLGCA